VWVNFSFFFFFIYIETTFVTILGLFMRLRLFVRSVSPPPAANRGAAVDDEMSVLNNRFLDICDELGASTVQQKTWSALISGAYAEAGIETALLKL
jgi:hypothetical protein